MRNVGSLPVDQLENLLVGCPAPDRTGGQANFLPQVAVCDGRVVPRETNHAVPGLAKHVHFGLHRDILASGLLIVVVNYKHAKLAHVLHPAAPRIQRVSRPSIRRTPNSRKMFPPAILRRTRLPRCKSASHFRVRPEN